MRPTAPAPLAPAPLTEAPLDRLRRRVAEAAPLAGLGLAGLLVLAFVTLAEEVVEGGTAGFDQAILLALRTPGNPADPLGPRWFEEAMRDVTALGGFTILGLLTLATALFLAMTRKRGAALFLLAAVLGGMLLSTLLKMGFQRPRPGLVPHATQVFTASFPSGHAMLSAVVYLTLGALLARLQSGRATKAFLLGLGIGLTLLVGASRVYLGVHWPTDVIAGWSVGAAWASLCWFVELRLQARGEVERADPPVPGQEAAAP